MYFALLKGFSISGGLIMAIGAQNAFVIRQGLLGRHLFLIAILCSIIDAFLIALGVLGFGKVIALQPILIEVTKYAAIVFLFIYGAISFRSALKPKFLENHQEKSSISAKKTVLIILALSFLNPHAYLDTVILLGSIASQQPAYEQIFFGLGAITASFTWFFAITYGSRLFAPLLSKASSWKIIDIAIALTMWGIATTLIMAF